MPLSNHALAVVATIALSIVGAVGDYFLKKASLLESPLLTVQFLVGFAVYSSVAIGWVFVMRHLKLGAMGAVYCVTTVLLMTVLGLLFNERLNAGEIVGICLAVISIVLMYRFA